METTDGRRCVDCDEHKPADAFYRHKTGSLYTRCKPCHYAQTQRWRAANREKIRELDRKRYPQDQARKIAQKRLRKYGLTVDEFEALIAKQGGVCPICLKGLATSTLGMPSGDWNLPSVDHCHDTGRVRGVLHRRCNLAIEFLLADDALDRARRYLAS